MEEKKTIPEKSGEQKQAVEDKIIIRMRKCGRILLHDFSSGDKDYQAKLAFLSETEKRELSVLLKKCLVHWKSSEEQV